MLSRLKLALGTSAFCLPLAVHAQDVDLEDVELVINAREPVDVTINDQPVRLLIAPDAVSAVAVNADTAARLGLEPSMVGFVFVIGSTRLPFTTDTVRYAMQGGTFRRRTAYSDAQIVDGADGVVAPGHLPQQRVVFNLRESASEDRALVFPLERMGRSLVGTVLDVGGVPIHVSFSFDRSESLVTATGGRMIADDRGGYFTEEARDMTVLYRVVRPVRPLALRQPLMLGELEVRNLAVRVGDHGNADGIDEAVPQQGDPDEIVVTANTGDMPRQRLYAGMDTIGHCSSITYDFAVETLTLMCPPQPASGTS